MALKGKMHCKCLEMCASVSKFLAEYPEITSTVTVAIAIFERFNV